MSKYSVLVLDDDKAVADSLKDSLDFFDEYVTTVTYNGHDALERVRHTPFDAYLVDQRMPEMTGVEFIVRLQELVDDPIVYVITAEDDGIALAAAEKSEEEGRLPIKRYVQKPWANTLFSVDLRQDLRAQDVKHELMRRFKEYSHVKIEMQHGMHTHMSQMQQKVDSLEHDVRRAKKHMVNKQEDTIVGEAKTNLMKLFLHETRTPLYGILGFAQLLQSTPTLTESQQEWVKLIIASGNKLNDFLRKLTLLSDLRQGMLPFLSFCNIDMLMKDVVKRCEFFMEEKELSISYECVVADQLMLDGNLMTTAMTYVLEKMIHVTRPEGIIIISVTKRAGKCAIILSTYVMDNVVINLDKMFDECAPDDMSVKRNSGLELAVARYIMHMHNGDICGHHNDGGGISLVVSLPMPTEEVYGAHVL